MATLAKGTWWRRLKGLPFTEVLYGVTATTARWIAVGSDSGSPRIYTVEASDIQDISPTVTARTPGGALQLWSVAWLSDENVAVAVGTSGTMETSTDSGLTWSNATRSPANTIHSVVAKAGDANSNMVAAGIDIIWGRASGGAWTTRWTGSQTWRSITQLPGAGWVAVGDNGYASHSPTGINGTFTAPYLVGTARLRTIGANSSYFIAAGDGGGAYRSATGLSGSWTQLDVGTTLQLRAIAPLANTLEWVVFDQAGYSWVTGDDGNTWTRNNDTLGLVIFSLWNDTATAVASGQYGVWCVSYDQTQEDYVSPVTAPAVDPAFSENADMAGDAVRRLVTQFRSGRG